MKIDNLDTNRYKRFFAFGCSFTNYIWPTWADIIGKNIPFYENWGKAGSGNHFIFNSFVEANARHKFNKDDLIIIMWTNKEREDRYHNNGWLTAPNKNLASVYGKDWFLKYGADSKGFLVRDLALISAVHEILQHTGCDWENFMINPITHINDDLVKKDGLDVKNIHIKKKFDYWIRAFDDLCEGKDIDPYFEHKEVIELYKSVFSNINKTFEGRWDFEYKTSRKFILNDAHPTPIEALQFLDTVWPNNSLEESSKKFAIDWTEKLKNIKSFDDLQFQRDKIIRL
jgi:hypothetical protein